MHGWIDGVLCGWMGEGVLCELRGGRGNGLEEVCGCMGVDPQHLGTKDTDRNWSAGLGHLSKRKADAQTPCRQMRERRPDL